jgi:hypothetical protein
MPEVDNHHLQMDWVRTNHPVLRDESSGCFFLTRHDDVRACLQERHSKDPDTAEPGTFLERAGKPSNPERPNEPASIGYLDPPDHQRVRHIITQALYRRIAVARPLIEGVVRERLAALEDKPAFDAIDDYAIPAPLEVFGRMIGLAREEIPQFRQWAIASFKIFQTVRSVEENFAMNSANEALSRWLDEAMVARRAEPRDDLVTDLVQMQAAGEGLSDGEIRANCISLVVASTMTTTDVIGSAIWLFLTHPGELAKLKADPALIKPAVEEVLRVEPPIESEWRVMTDDVEIGGCPVRRGQVVSVSINAANRDPSVFDAPHVFDITREHHPHLSFGAGEHICVGAPLGRMTAQVAIQAFFDHFPDVRLTDPDAAPNWRRTPYFRGLETLPVSL